MKRASSDICRLILILLVLPAGVRAEEQVSQYEVEAAFLVKLAFFTEWPDEALEGLDSLTICVLGENPFGEHLTEEASDKEIQGLPLRLVYTTDIDDIEDAQIVYLAADSPREIRDAIARIERLPILTVSDAPLFARRKGMLGFYLEDDRVRFEVNRRAVQKAGLVLSSKLLKLARLVP